MKIISILIFLLFGSMEFLYGQTINSKDIILTTNLPDNISGRYNMGLEYFFKTNKKVSESNKFSVGLNGGIISTTNKNQNVKGYNIIVETNLYTDLTLPKKWNEYGGLKVSYGNFTNETLSEKKSSYYIGASTGIQPIVLKRIALKISGDIGYIKNGLSNMAIFNNSNEVFYSGFNINFNVGVGLRF